MCVCEHIFLESQCTVHVDVPITSPPSSSTHHSIIKSPKAKGPDPTSSAKTSQTPNQPKPSQIPPRTPTQYLNHLPRPSLKNSIHFISAERPLYSHLLLGVLDAPQRHRAKGTLSGKQRNEQLLVGLVGQVVS